MRGKLFPLLLILATIFLSLTISLAPLLAVQHKPFGNYHVDPESKILYPRLGAPVVTKTGSSFSVFVKSDLKEGTAWTATIQSLFDRYDLTVDKAEVDSPALQWSLKIAVPDSVLRGLYNLTVRPSTSSSMTFSEPNSVFVVGSKYPDTIRLAVITDTHYGINSPYYDLRTKILRSTVDALNSMGLDFIIGAGDMTDATVDEQVFSSFKAEMVRLRVPILMAPGNNDYQSILRGQYLWEKYLAPNSASLDFGNYHFTMLDSQVGSIADEQLRWARDDLGSVPAGNFKVMVFHYPYWTEVHSSLKVDVPRIITDYNVGLTLHGHWHYDYVTTSPTLSIVTTSLSTSDQFVGYRLFSLTPTGVQYTPQSLPYNKLNVAYLQHNDFSSTGGAVLIKNGLANSINLTLIFLLINSPKALDKPIVEGGSIARSTSPKSPGGREVVQVLTSVGAGQQQLVTAYYEKDATPPSITLSTHISGSTVQLIPTASDIGLGVMSLHVFYSEDNKTWVEILPKVMDQVEQWAFTTSAPRVYLKAESIDGAGLSTVKYMVLELVSTTTSTVQTMRETPPNLVIYAGVFMAGIVIAVAVVLIRRKSIKRKV
jgi:predicted phosphodiesterase